MTTATSEADAIGPAAMDPVTFIDNEHFTALVSTPGLYVVTARVTDAAGAVYTDSSAILVMDKAGLDALLKAKWNGMKAALAAGNIEGGVQCYGGEFLSLLRLHQHPARPGGKCPRVVSGDH
jgi:hypothetical protein